MSLMETSLGNITWADLKLPFESFVVNFEVPMLVRGGRKSSSIMITSCQSSCGSDAIELRFFDDDLVLDFTPHEKETIESYLKNKIPLGFLLAKKIKEIVSRPNVEKSASTATTLIVPKIKETKISTSLVDLFCDSVNEANKSEELEKYLSSFDNGLHIALGLCLYLQTIPSSKKYNGVGGDNLDWIDLPKKSKLGNNAITDISKVCSIGKTHLIKENECEKRAILEIKKSYVSGSEKSTHFRRGTWCRKPGTGNDQNAPRIIWRRPTMVRSDKLQQNSLPIGQRIIVG